MVSVHAEYGKSAVTETANPRGSPPFFRRSAWIHPAIGLTDEYVEVEGFGRCFAPGVGKSAARWPVRRAKPSIGGDLTAFRFKTLPTQSSSSMNRP
jgi:hypothetical protein